MAIANEFNPANFILWSFDGTNNQTVFNAQSVPGASGVVQVFDFQPVINQSGTAGYTAIRIAITETATGSGAKNALDIQKPVGTSLFTINNAGNIITQGGISAGGIGVPAIRSYVRSTALIAASGTQATFTPTADGSFIVGFNVLVTTATTHTFTVTCAYTDEGNNARTATLDFVLVAGGAPGTSITNTNGTVPYMGIPQQIRVKGGTAITLQSAAGGTYTTVVYNLETWIQQIA
jgi:hypothetical protein